MMNEIEEESVIERAVEHPRCGVGGCKRGITHHVFAVLYPVAPVVAAPTFTSRGARVLVGSSCKKHRETWTVASFLNSPAWLRSSNRQRFLNDFGLDPEPSYCRIEVVRS